MAQITISDPATLEGPSIGVSRLGDVVLVSPTRLDILYPAYDAIPWADIGRITLTGAFSGMDGDLSGTVTGIELVRANGQTVVTIADIEQDFGELAAAFASPDSGAWEDLFWTLTEGADTIDGASGSDFMVSGDGDDLITGNGGDDEYYDEAGNDTFDGGDGDNDTYDAYLSDDGVRIDLSAGTAVHLDSGETDVLIAVENASGSDYNDTIIGDAGDNLLSGELGSDLLVGGGGYDVVSFAYEDGKVRVDLAAGRAEVSVDTGPSDVDTLVGFIDVFGSDQDDQIAGDAEGNYLLGEAGNDTIDGRSGDDVLIGGAGSDVMTGGAGDDVFQFGSAEDIDGDRITDFITGDVIDLSALDAAFIGTMAFTGTDGSPGRAQIRFQAGTDETRIEIDADGKGRATNVIVLTGQRQIAEEAPASGTLVTTHSGVPTRLSIVAETATRDEGNSGTSAFTFTVTRTGDATGIATVAYAVAGSGSAPAGPDDFGGAAPSGTVSFAAGETAKTISIPVSGDRLVEPDETFTVTLSQAAGATIETATASATIRNDDAPDIGGISVAPSSANRPEGNIGAVSFTFVVTRSGDVAGAASVDWAVAGTGASPADSADFGGTLPKGTVTFAVGETARTITVAVSGDTDIEADELFTVTLSNPKGATIAGASAAGRIDNDDILPADPAAAVSAATASPVVRNEQLVNLKALSRIVTVSGGGTITGSAIDGAAIIIADAENAVTLVGGGARDQLMVANDVAGTVINTGTGSGTVVGGAGGQLLGTSTVGGSFKVYGGTGNDTVIAAAGNNTIAAGLGNNLVGIVGGSNLLFAAGNDTVIAASGNNVIGLGSGESTVVAAGGNNLIIGGSGNSAVFIQSGNQTVLGGIGNTTLVGGTGGDYLIGATGKNGVAAMFGDGGNDTLVGGVGTSLMYGGDGIDLFVFSTVFGGGRTVIGDFKAGTDRIAVQGYGSGVTATSLAQSVHVSGGNSVVTLSDGTTILVAGVTNLSASSFLV